jgi:diaminohydroxyphosphoribosylaminopyrimidine deaminase / 5-amino-6-(5-phosphoribosylamino)uracil reductase
LKLSPRQAMSLAIEEAKRGAGFVSPNPLVGCVILDYKNELIASGYHARVGEAHAEINALNSIRNPSLLDGAQVFVTLEPCAHHGRTGPCAEALAKTTITSVTYGLADPNPQVAGKGAEILRAAGKKVSLFSELQDDLENLAEVFLTNMRHKKPFVGVKVGSSLDGQIALKSGESQWITNEESRAHVQWLRGTFDAVLVGAKTFLKDNPSLNSRDPLFAQKPQRAVLIDPDGSTLSKLIGSNLLSVRKPSDLFVVVRKDVAWPKELSEVNRVEIEGKDVFPWDQILQKLFEAKILSILVEGGAFVIGQLLKEKKVDRVFTYLAQKILGAGLGWSSAFEIENLKGAVTLSSVKTKSFGSDILITGRILIPPSEDRLK